MQHNDTALAVQLLRKCQGRCRSLRQVETRRCEVIGSRKSLGLHVAFVINLRHDFECVFFITEHQQIIYAMEGNLCTQQLKLGRSARPNRTVRLEFSRTRPALNPTGFPTRSRFNVNVRLLHLTESGSSPGGKFLLAKGPRV